jgi:hypothetical protein
MDHLTGLNDIGTRAAINRVPMKTKRRLMLVRQTS